MYSTPEEVWQLVERGKEAHRKINLYPTVRKNYNFFEGRQWEGLIADSTPPIDNIVKHIVTYKHTTMAMQDIQSVFTSDDEQYQKVAEALNKYSENVWEDAKLRDHLRKMAKDACISGNAYLYMADINNFQQVDTCDMYLADEVDGEIQHQEYLLIEERLDVKTVREIAEQNGIEDIELIVADEVSAEKSQAIEVKSELGRITSYLLMWKQDGTVHSLRAVRNVIYSPEIDTKLKLYPVVGMTINRKKWSARGIGEVAPLIPNQIALNKTLYRRVESVKDVCFPKIVYNGGVLQNPSDLTKVGSAIEVNGTIEIDNVMRYIQPSYIGSAAKELTDELILTTKELNGSGDGATGQIDPEKASGEAIKAVTQQASITSSENQNEFNQTVKGLGELILEWWRNYNPNGIEVEVETEKGVELQVVPIEVINSISFDIHTAPATPYDRYVTEESLRAMLTNGLISFEEWVEALDPNGNEPKAAYQRIIDNRRAKALAKEQSELNKYKQIAFELQKMLARYESAEITKGE